MRGADDEHLLVAIAVAKNESLQMFPPSALTFGTSGSNNIISVSAKDGCYTVPHVAADDAHEGLLHATEKIRPEQEVRPPIPKRSGLSGNSSALN